MPHTHRLTAVVLLVLVSVAAGCGGLGREEVANPGRGVTLALDFQPNAVHAGVFTTMDRGYDRKEDLSLRVRTPAGSSDSLSGVLDWATTNLDRPISVADLAARAHLAPRTLARRFRDDIGTTPQRWLTQQRVALAQRLLETTTAGIDQIASDAGFITAVTLRHHFQQILGTSPTTYRKQFHRAS